MEDYRHLTAPVMTPAHCCSARAPAFHRPFHGRRLQRCRRSHGASDDDFPYDVKQYWICRWSPVTSHSLGWMSIPDTIEDQYHFY